MTQKPKTSFDRACKTNARAFSTGIREADPYTET